MENPVLVEVIRGELVESFHRGVICVVDRNNNVLFSKGNINQLCYPRSSMKYFQHLPLLEGGAIEKFGFTMQEIAVMCGSHNAEEMHLETVKSILAKINLPITSLKCGSHYPLLQKDIVAMYEKHELPTDLHNNCSGKHAGFLAYCVFHQMDINDYLNPIHPLQIAIKKTCAEMYEVDERTMQVAIDGCSAPIYSVSVFHQAVAYKNLCDAEKFGQKRQEACQLLIKAVSSHPEMVAGTNRYCTDMMKLCADQIIGKTGAEGIFCMVLHQKKVGVCIKIDDGKMLPQYNVAHAFIEASALFSSEKLLGLNKYMEEDIVNWKNIKTGKIRIVDDLFDGLVLE